MKHAPFLHQERKRSSDQSEQVKDFSVFDFNYIPKEPLLRDEGKLLIKVVISAEKGAIKSAQMGATQAINISVRYDAVNKIPLPHP